MWINESLTCFVDRTEEFLLSVAPENALKCSVGYNGENLAIVSIYIKRVFILKALLHALCKYSVMNI